MHRCWWDIGVSFCFLQLGIQRLVESGRYDTHDNFTVVIQTSFQNPKIPLDQVWYKETSEYKELSAGTQPLETVRTIISACRVLFLLELVAFWPSRLDYQFFVLHIVLPI